MPKQILITGPKGSGKTTLCGEITRLAREAGWVVKGILSPAVFEKGSKVGIDMVDTSTGKRRRLARLAQTGDQTRTPRWGFHDDAIAWGNEILAVSTPCDLLLVDELGPLEFLRGEGLLNGLTAIDSGTYHAAIIVIRPSLLNLALSRWPDAEVVEVSASDQVSSLAGAIFERIFLVKNKG